MTFLYLKAVHIVFIVTWFAGLFYIPRLFIYIIEANSRPDQEKKLIQQQLMLMTSRLWYIITWPSAVITLVMGAALLVVQPVFLQYPFMQIKLGLVVLLYAYHYSLHVIFRQLSRGIVKYTSQQMRMWNEVSTILLISIVFLIVVRTALSLAWSMGGLAALIVVMLLAIRLYRKSRKS